jgi:hypothetical protein
LFSVAGTTDTTYFLASVSSDTIYIGNYSTVILATSQVLRDPSAWYHIVIVLDTTQATANNRLKLYINGTQVTAFSNNNIATYYTQNSSQGINQAAAHSLGRETQGGVYYHHWRMDPEEVRRDLRHQRVQAELQQWNVYDYAGV